MANAAIPASEAPTDRGLDMDTEPLISKSPPHLSEDISATDSGNEDDPNGNCEKPRMKMKKSSKNTEPELQVKENDLPHMTKPTMTASYLCIIIRIAPRKRTLKTGH